MKTVLTLVMLVMAFNALASSKVVVKLGSNSRSLKSNLTKLQKELKIAEKKLIIINNMLAIPSHAAGEVSNLYKTMLAVKGYSKVGEIAPPIRSDAATLIAEIEEMAPTVEKAKRTVEEVSELIEPIREEISDTRKAARKITGQVWTYRKKTLTNFYEEITTSQDCVYKAKNPLRSCMQDKLDSVADDMDPVIEDSNQAVIALLLAIDKVEGKIAQIKKVLNEIAKIAARTRKLEHNLHIAILPLIEVKKLMNKHYTMKFTYPNPYKSSKRRWFTVKLSGQEIIKGVHHIMNELKSSLKGSLLKDANKYGLKKIAKKLYKTLDIQLKKVLKKLKLRINAEVRGISRLHELDDTLMDPLEELRNMIKDIKLEMENPKAVSCDELRKECK